LFLVAFFVLGLTRTQTCLSRCFDRYMEACKRTHALQIYFTREADNPDHLVNIISRTYATRLNKERLEGQF
jgi:hypothetical protein